MNMVTCLHAFPRSGSDDAVPGAASRGGGARTGRTAELPNGIMHNDILYTLITAYKTSRVSRGLVVSKTDFFYPKRTK
jgi:hypothetical protein